MCCKNISIFIVLTCADTGTPPATSPENSFSVTVAIAKQNIQKIDKMFAMLVSKSLEKLQREKIRVEDFLTFLVRVYSSPNSRDGRDLITTVIGPAKNLDEIFHGLSTCRLWDYLNYFLLQSIIEEFLQSDKEMNDMMGQYLKDLTDYILTLQVEAYIHAKENSANTIFSPQISLCFKILTVKCKSSVTEQTLNYVSDMRQSLLHQFTLFPNALIPLQ